MASPFCFIGKATDLPNFHYRYHVGIVSVSRKCERPLDVVRKDAKTPEAPPKTRHIPLLGRSRFSATVKTHRKVEDQI